MLYIYNKSSFSETGVVIMLRRSVFILLSSILLFSFLSAQDEFFEPKTTVGGYGELHYNWSKSDGADEAKKVLDFHRFVLFYSHSWTEKWSFKSEVELEHNFVSDGEGELELEQAYINYHHNNAFGFQVGVVLPSVGFINEYHEPPLFFSVERPEYSKYIIPTTLFGNGAAIYGRYSDFSYKAVIMEGLDGASIKEKQSIRSGRVKGFKANAKELLYNGRVDYSGIPGLWLGASFSYNDAYVGVDSIISISLVEVHAKYEAKNVIALFEYGNIAYDGKDVGFNIESAMGYYFDLGYNIASFIDFDGKIIPWVRYTDYNTTSSVIGGGDSEKANHNKKWLVGLSIKPIDQVVFKLDYGVLKNDLSRIRTKLFNLGAGYMF